MDLNLTNKIVVVAGGTSGIGLSIASAFLREEARVAVIGRSVEKLNNVGDQFKKELESGALLLISADVTKPENVITLIQNIMNKFGKIDVLVANVGDGKSEPDALPSRERFLSTWEKNFTSAELIVRESLPYIEETSGAIIFISSIAGIESIGAPTDYSVAKSAIISLSKNLARKLAPTVRVNCIAPGNVYFPGGSWDEKIKQNPERVENIIQSTVPMKRFGTPEEIADATVFLSSSRAGFITGSCMIIDGGQTVSLH